MLVSRKSDSHLIKKNHYILICVNDEGENEYKTPVIQDEKTRIGEYCYDLDDVNKWIRHELGQKYKKILICKVVDLVAITQQSVYEQ